MSNKTDGIELKFEHGPRSVSRERGCECGTCTGNTVPVLAAQWQEIQRQEARADVKATIVVGASAALCGVATATIGLLVLMAPRLGWWTLLPGFFGLVALIMLALTFHSALTQVRSMAPDGHYGDEERRQRLATTALADWYYDMIRRCGPTLDRKFEAVNTAVTMCAFALLLLVVTALNTAVMVLVIG